MSLPDHDALDTFAESLTRARLAGFVDFYAERLAEASWRFRDGRLVRRGAVLREGAALRRGDSVLSTDGLDRAVLSSLVGLSTRELAPLSPPPFPSPPNLGEIPEVLPGGDCALRWRWSWAVVVAGGRATRIARPELLEITHADGLRQLASWPIADAFRPVAPPSPPDGIPRAGRTTVLLAPAAAAVFVHELFGHSLEADVLLRGASPWAGRSGQRIVPLALDLDDDPTESSLPGSFSADDEGVAAAPRPLLRGGVLVGALADRASAAALGVAPGNARRAGVHAPPRPRLSNLMARAEGSGEPPRAEARLEVASISSGTIAPQSGELMLAVRSAWALRRGERARALAPFTLVGELGRVCSGLLAAGGRPEPTAAPGWCGKNGDVVPTGALTPWLLVTGLEVR